MRRRLFLSSLPATVGVAPAQRTSSSLASVPSGTTPLGYGIARAHTDPQGVLHFYNRPAPDNLPSGAAPVDTVQFGPGQPHVQIQTAPPWFVPEVLKLDYDTLLLRVLTIQRNWVEVLVNQTDGRTHWIGRDSADVLSWPEFLLGVAAVEPLDPAANPLRLKPLDHASPIQGASSPYSVVAAQEQWLGVRPAEKPGDLQGWIRWKKQGQLTVSYSILS